MFAGPLIGQAMSFLLGPGGRLLAIVLAFVGWTMYHRVDATRDCEDAQLRADLIESQRQLTIATEIAEKSRLRADLTTREMTELERAYAELETTLTPDNSCILDSDTRKRLLDIQ